MAFEPDPDWNGGRLYQAILMFAGGKRYLMRAPIKLWHELYWLDKCEKTNNHSKATRGYSNDLLKSKLKDLEREGYIRRFPGGIEIMENIHV